LDEVALQRSQSIGTKAMKAALKGKRKADKEREALINAEGLDSIATIAEHLEAEAIWGFALCLPRRWSTKPRGR